MLSFLTFEALSMTKVISPLREGPSYSCVDPYGADFVLFTPTAEDLEGRAPP